MLIQLKNKLYPVDKDTYQYSYQTQNSNFQVMLQQNFQWLFMKTEMKTFLINIDTK